MSGLGSIGQQDPGKKLLVDSCVIIDCFHHGSPNREASLRFVEHMNEVGRRMTMPAHGWYEVWCTLNRLSDVDRSYLPPLFAGKMQLEVELIHIDEQFIRRYGNTKIPYTKAADHIFIVVAHNNAWPLVTSDRKMLEVCNELGVNARTPTEYLSGRPT